MKAFPGLAATRDRGALAAGVLPALALFTVLSVGGYLRGPTLDASVFMQIAELVRGGGMPYRDVFDHKPPGIFLTEAWVGTLFTWIHPWLRAWSITWVAGLGTLAIVHALLARVFGRRTSMLATFGIVPILAGYPFTVGGGHTESLAVLFVAAGFGVAIVAEGRMRTAVFLGVLLAAGLATSLQVLAGAVASAVVLQARWRSPAAALGIAIGGAMVAVPLLVWIVGSGAWGAAFDQLIVYNAAYAAQNRGFLGAAPWVLALATVTAAPSLVAAAIGIARVRRPSVGGWLGAGALIWVVAWIGYLMWQGRLVGHHVIAVTPAFAVLGALTLERLGTPSRGTTSSLRAHAALMVAIAALGLAGLGIPGQPGRPRQLEVAVPLIVSAAAERETATLFVWGNEPSIYLQTALQPASRYIYMLPLELPGYASAALIDALVLDWEQRPPDVIVDVSRNPDGVQGPALVEGDGPASRADGLGPLRAFVLERYRVHGTVDGWVVYRLRVRT